jgi:hypothetical protein
LRFLLALRFLLPLRFLLALRFCWLRYLKVAQEPRLKFSRLRNNLPPSPGSPALTKPRPKACFTARARASR